MFGLFDTITEFFTEVLLGMIQANLEAMFLDINDNINLVATEVGKTPSSWNSDVFSFIEAINDSVIIPVAGIIITAVMCIELINMVMEKNNMHSDTDTFDFFKYVMKMWVAVWFVSNAFTFSMAVFDLSQTIVTKAAGVINASSSIDSLDINAMMDQLSNESIWNLILIVMDTSLVKLSIQIVSIIIIVITYGRMIEICLYSSVAAIPFATMGNKEWGQIGTNYIKSLFALGLQGLLLMICFGIYGVLVKTIHITTDIHTSIFAVLGYTVLLVMMMLKTGSISKSILNAH